MSMSSASSSVFTVYGRVGVVDDGMTLASPHTLMMSGACPPPGSFGVKCVNGSALEGRDSIFDKAAFVQRVGVDENLDIHLVGHGQTAVDGRGSRTPVFMKFQAACPGFDLLDEPCRQACIAFAEESKIHGKASAACSIRSMCQGPGVQVVAVVPAAGPVPPPIMVVRPE